MTPSDWSVVDAAAEPRRLLSGLDALRAEPFFAQSKSRIAALLAASGGGRMLDVGCGTGDDAADLVAEDRIAIGVERSTVMCTEARRRDATLPLLAADARALPIAGASVDAVRADRVLQHLPDARAAAREWLRVLRPGGRLACFDPDLTTATVTGVNERLAATVLEWRHGTRPGAAFVHDLEAALGEAGFVDATAEPFVLELADLNRADGIMGLARWGHAAEAAGMLPPHEAQRWHDDVHAAANDGTLRYRCVYLLGTARAPARY